MYYPRFTKVIIHYFLIKDKTISKRNKIGMHTYRDDYLINTLRFISAKEESQIYGARLPKSMTSPEMRETKAYKTYLGYAIGLKRVKRPAKKSTNALTSCVVIRDTPVKSLSKKKEKITVEKCKGIDLLSKVATKEVHYEEVLKKSLRDFHKTHPSGSGTVTKLAPSAAKIKPYVTNEGTGVKPGVPDVTEEESTESEAESWGKDEDDRNYDHDSKSEGSDQERDSGDDNTQSDNEKGSDSEYETDENESDETNDESKVEDKGRQEGTPILEVMIVINVQQWNENLEILINQVIEDAHVIISTVPKKTKVPVTSSSHSSDLASKFLKFSNIPYIDEIIVSPMDVLVHYEVPSNQTPTLLTVPVSVITESSPRYTTVIP
ncbi:hypothetical protein Tco_0322568 [Tanacetum coccineum]